jgi:hypothetical protein
MVEQGNPIVICVPSMSSFMSLSSFLVVEILLELQLYQWYILHHLEKNEMFQICIKCQMSFNVKCLNMCVCMCDLGLNRGIMLVPINKSMYTQDSSLQKNFVIFDL